MGKVINLEYGFLESRNRLSRNFFLENGNLKKNLGPPDPPGVCVGGGGVGGMGDDYRGCYGDPVFEIRDYCF